MIVSLKVAFSILDSKTRLSTSTDDVYRMLNYIHDNNLFTHQLIMAMDGLRNVNPDWFKEAVAILDKIKKHHNTDDFSELMKVIDSDYPNIEIELKKLTE